jgi:hypothetical protein
VVVALAFVAVGVGVFLGLRAEVLSIAAATRSGNDPNYLFQSSVGANLLPSFGDIVLLGGLVTVYRHRRCVECWRLSHHKTEDTAQRFCRHHWTREHVDKHRERHRLRFPRHLAHEEDP